MTNEEVVRAACKSIWSDGELDRIGEFYAEDFVANYPNAGWGEGGVAGVRTWAEQMFTAFPDYREEVADLVADRDWVVVYLIIRGTHEGEFMGIPATGKEFEIVDCTWCRVRNKKIVEQKGLTDMYSALVQLGVLPAPAPSDS